MITTKEELQQLIGKQESRTIDFKQTLILDNKGDTLELLKDVCSFANTVGGQIIYGMKEENEVATELIGIEIENLGSFMQSIENKVKEMIEPRIPGVNFKSINLSGNNYAIVINIPKSWLGPHGFMFDKGWRFYLRGSTQSYIVDIDQLRDLFTQSDQLTQIIRSFRDKRISEILADATSLKFSPALKSKLVLHIIPTISFSPTFSIDFTKLEPIKNRLNPIFSQGTFQRYNFDGFLTYDEYWEGGGLRNYFQLFRNGIIETVDASVINYPRKENDNTIDLTSVQSGILDYLRNYFELYQQMEIESSIVFYFSMLNVKGRPGRVTPEKFFFNSYDLDRDNLFFPETIFNSPKDNVDEKAEEILLPMWQSFGSNKVLI